MPGELGAAEFVAVAVPVEEADDAGAVAAQREGLERNVGCFADGQPQLAVTA